jgi:hypothetical protein
MRFKGGVRAPDQRRKSGSSASPFPKYLAQQVPSERGCKAHRRMTERLQNRAFTPKALLLPGAEHLVFVLIKALRVDIDCNA